MSSSNLNPVGMSRRRTAVAPHSAPSLQQKSTDTDSSEASPRARLIATARRLFYREGPRAVGIDRVLAESGVAKMSLYRHFDSKDALITACLEEHEKDYWALWDSAISHLATDPVKKLQNVFRFIAIRTSDPNYQGCIFLNTVQSFPNESHPAHQAAVRHKQELACRLHRLCEDANAAKPQALAQQLLLLINGAQATAGMLGKETQMSLIDAADELLRAQGISLQK
jgi:AcrR family transcriptional regulator